MSLLNIFLVVLAVLLSLVGLVGLGFTLRPRPFRAHPAPSQPGIPAPFRPDLPGLVHHHFVQTIGEMPQQIQSAVVWGRGRACIRGVWMPLRFKAWYRPGEAFYRRMELTFFRRPVMRGIDKYIGGKGVFTMGGRSEEGPKIDQGQVLALWAETVWMPSVFVHHPHIRWEPVDQHTARLELPKRGDGESLLAHFDEQTGQMTHFTAYRFSTESDKKEPWRFDLLDWRSEHGMSVPCEIAVASGESGSPWAYWTLDGIAYNVNVDDQLGDI